MNPGLQVNHLDTGKASAPPSQGEPPAYSPQSGELGTRQVKNVMHLKEYINNKAYSDWNNSTLTHEEFEKQLWVANCFIIPLIVYPIVSLFGHLVIAITRDEYAETYDKIRDYLKGKAELNQTKAGEEVLLNDDDLNNIQKIFDRHLYTETSGDHFVDPRLRKDCFYQTLQVHKKSEAESTEDRMQFYF